MTARILRARFKIPPPLLRCAQAPFRILSLNSLARYRERVRVRDICAARLSDAPRFLFLTLATRADGRAIQDSASPYLARYFTQALGTQCPRRMLESLLMNPAGTATAITSNIQPMIS